MAADEWLPGGQACLGPPQSLHDHNAYVPAGSVSRANSHRFIRLSPRIGAGCDGHILERRCFKLHWPQLKPFAVMLGFEPSLS